MYASCVKCGSSSRFLVRTSSNSTETWCESCADEGDVLNKRNHKRSTLPLSELPIGNSEVRFRAGCDMCSQSGPSATFIARWEDGLGVVTTEARCREHLPSDIDTRRNLEEIDIRPEDMT